MTFRSPSEFLRYVASGLMTRLGQLGARLGWQPNAITLLGILPTLIAALLAASGQFFAAGVVLLIGAPLDALDGAVARAKGCETRFGALLDSTVDRYTDALMLSGIGYAFAQAGDLLNMLLAFGALSGAYAVSYVRARAEGLGIGSIKDGLFDRAARIIVLILALLTGALTLGLLVLTIGGHLTALQRLWIAHRATRDD
ncbi:MAG: CDP-alcohol phosphatidyltransferase family protein [Anaerolineae bacterium]|nr:CDP-alcohol phosphatidyltransferase family protein [Anaerolineae bacterium]